MESEDKSKKNEYNYHLIVQNQSMDIKVVEDAKEKKYSNHAEKKIEMTLLEDSKTVNLDNDFIGFPLAYVTSEKEEDFQD